MKFKVLMKKLWRKVRGGNPDVYELRLRGVSIGENCHIYGSIDYGHEFLVTIGDNVTLASGSKLLTHDGSTKKILGYSRVGRIDIGNDVFIGASSIVLPNVKIGDKVIVGAGCIVTRIFRIILWWWEILPILLDHMTIMWISAKNNLNKSLYGIRIIHKNQMRKRGK